MSKQKARKKRQDSPMPDLGSGMAVVNDIHRLLDELEAFIDEAANRASEGVEMLHHQATRGIKRVRASISGKSTRQVLNSSVELFSDARNYLRKHPWQAAAAATAVAVAVVSRHPPAELRERLQSLTHH